MCAFVWVYVQTHTHIDRYIYSMCCYFWPNCILFIYLFVNSEITIQITLVSISLEVYP